MLKKYIKKVVEGEDLTSDEMIKCMDNIMSGDSNDILISSFLTALRCKGETYIEIASAAKVMRAKASLIDLGNKESVDVVGTGGDLSGTFNVSTTAAFVVAGAGMTVSKHGNRSVSSKSGSADVLEELGVNINISPDQVKECIEDCHIGFMFAPKFHSAMKYVMPARKTMGMRTIFNLLGPLTNPAFAKYQVTGVFDSDLTEDMALALKELGTDRTLVVHGEGNIDELTVTGKSKITELKDGKIETYRISPEDVGLKTYNIEEIKGGDAVCNALILKDILDGEEKGAKRDMVLINSGAALYVSGKAKSIAEGVKLAAESIDSGNARKKLDALIEKTKKLGA